MNTKYNGKLIISSLVVTILDIVLELNMGAAVLYQQLG